MLSTAAAHKIGGGLGVGLLASTRGIREGRSVKIPNQNPARFPCKAPKGIPRSAPLLELRQK